MHPLVVSGLFIITAVVEILGCWLALLAVRGGWNPWQLGGAALSLGGFAWLLTLHPAAAGRVYAAYGGIYVAVAILWLWLVDGVRPDRWDLIGAGLCIVGTAVIYFAPRGGPGAG